MSIFAILCNDFMLVFFTFHSAREPFPCVAHCWSSHFNVQTADVTKKDTCRHPKKRWVDDVLKKSLELFWRYFYLIDFSCFQLLNLFFQLFDLFDQLFFASSTLKLNHRLVVPGLPFFVLKLFCPLVQLLLHLLLLVFSFLSYMVRLLQM